MPLTIDKPYLGLRIAAHDGDLVFVPREGFCDGIVLDTPYIGLRAATHDGSLVYIISDQKLNAAGELIINKPYIGLRAATHDGDLVYVIDGKQCDQEDQTFCSCVICCTLEATVQFPDSFELPSAFETGIDVTLTCNRSFIITDINLCLNDEIEDDVICVQDDITYSGGSGTYNSAPYTIDWITTVWVSDVTGGGPTGLKGTHASYGEVTYTGNFRVFFTATQYTLHEEGETDIVCCSYEWGILVEYNVTEAGFECTADAWGYWIKRAFSADGAPCPGGVFYNSTDCPGPNNCCPDGYSNNTPDSSFLEIGHLFPSPTYVEGGSLTYSGCIYDESGDPIVIDEETYYRLTGDPDDDAHRIKFYTLTIADLCE